MKLKNTNVLKEMEVALYVAHGDVVSIVQS